MERSLEQRKSLDKNGRCSVRNTNKREKRLKASNQLGLSALDSKRR
jgi:hypothetical protein